MAENLLLIDTIQSLVRQHGLEACRKAMAEAAFSFTATKHENLPPLSRIRLDADSDYDGILTLLERSVHVNIALEISAIPREEDALRLERLLSTVQNDRVEWLQKYSTSSAAGNDDRGRWEELILSGYNAHMSYILSSKDCVQLFRRVVLRRKPPSEVTDITGLLIPDPLLYKVGTQIVKGNIDHLVLRDCWLSVHHAETLKRILMKAPLKSLEFGEIRFTDRPRCLLRLVEGFEQAYPRLENLTWKEMNLDTDSLPLRCLFIRSLGQMPTLRVVHVRLPLYPQRDDIAMALSDVLRSNCNIKTLHLVLEVDESSLPREWEVQQLADLWEQSCSHLIPFWTALKANTSLRTLNLVMDGSHVHYPDLPRSLVTNAMMVALSWQNTISSINVDTYAKTERGSVFDFEQLMELRTPASPQQSIHRKIRKLKNMFRGQAAATLMHLVKDRLPYVYDIGINTPLDIRDGNSSDFNRLKLQLEKNQVGMTLFRETVPAGLWSCVLEKAANSEPAPTSGIYCMVKELVKSGIIK